MYSLRLMEEKTLPLLIESPVMVKVLIFYLGIVKLKDSYCRNEFLA